MNKKTFFSFLLALLPWLASAQSLMVNRTLELLPNSMASVQYNNIFGNWENRELDDPFPYVVIRMNLSGDENAVRLAKLKIGLDVGTMQRVTATDKNQPNQILFLVPSGVRNIYVICGDGCEKQLLHSGSLIMNKIYTCQVEYQASPSPVNDDDMKDQMEQIQQILISMQQQGGNNQSSSDGQSKERSMRILSNGSLEFVLHDIIFKMVAVQGGTFSMSDPSVHGGAGDSKTACHVTLGSYYLGESEVTQALWQEVMGSNPSHWKDDNLPVENVSWDDCIEFVSRLNARTGKHFRLPTEAEWEYAACGGSKSRGHKYAGGKILGNVGWYSTNSTNQTHIVEQKLPNELGLYDMCGNVWEWCSDWYGHYGSGAQTDPTGTEEGAYRVYRGGGWNNSEKYCSPKYRNYGTSAHRSSCLGLRLALSE